MMSRSKMHISKKKYNFGTVACACLDTSRRRYAPPKPSTRPKNKKTGTNETQYRQRTGGGARPLADSPVVSSADEKLRC